MKRSIIHGAVAMVCMGLPALFVTAILIDMGVDVSAGYARGGGWFFVLGIASIMFAIYVYAKK